MKKKKMTKLVVFFMAKIHEMIIIIIFYPYDYRMYYTANGRKYSQYK